MGVVGSHVRAMSRAHDGRIAYLTDRFLTVRPFSNLRFHLGTGKGLTLDTEGWIPPDAPVHLRLLGDNWLLVSFPRQQHIVTLTDGVSRPYDPAKHQDLEETVWFRARRAEWDDPTLAVSNAAGGRLALLRDGVLSLQHHMEDFSPRAQEWTLDLAHHLRVQEAVKICLSPLGDYVIVATQRRVFAVRTADQSVTDLSGELHLKPATIWFTSKTTFVVADTQCELWRPMQLTF